MPDLLSIALRQIQREQAMRDSSKVPHIDTIRKIMDFILKNELYKDMQIRQWLIARSSIKDFWIIRCLLKLAAILVETGFSDDSLKIFNNVVENLTSSESSNSTKGLVQTKLGLLPELAKLICLPNLVSPHWRTWGKRLVELQADTLYGQQENEWPSTVDVRATLSEHLGEQFERPESFSPEYDDCPDIWYYQHGDRSDDVRCTIGLAIDNGLTEATRLTTSDAFSFIASQLIDTQWGLALCQPLVALYDALRSSTEVPSWLPSIVANLLTTPTIEKSEAAWHWRRLLRKQLAEFIDAKAQHAIINTIRQYASNDFIRVNELHDLETWSSFSESDRVAVDKARQSGDLCEPYDPRDLPKNTISWGKPSPQDEFVNAWPHKEDHESMKSLMDIQSPPAEDQHEEFEAWLIPRITALEVIVLRAEARNEDWFGEVTGWCREIVSFLKRFACNRENIERDQLTFATYETYLNQYCSWWRDQTETCLARLSAEIPEYHRKRESQHLGWGSNDPFYTSLSYIDELLAIEDGTSLEELRQQLAQTILQGWGEWPRFTRATILTVLRGYHWRTIEQLHSFLDTVVEDTLEADVLQRALEHLLRSGATNIVELLKSIWSRKEAIDNPEKIARFIGQVIGNATLRNRGDKELMPVLEEFAAWCDEIQAQGQSNLKTRLELVHGIVWAAKEHLGSTAELTTQHGNVWLGLARWAATEFLATPLNTRRSSVIMQAIMFVLEMNWSIVERRRLYEELGDILERVIRERNLDEYSTLLFQLKEEVGGATNDHVEQARPVAPSDELLLRLCRASAERVAEWHKLGETTNDLGYIQALSGRDTAELIEQVFQNARDREYVRRELPPIIDILASAELMSLATKLRLKLRC